MRNKFCILMLLWASLTIQATAQIAPLEFVKKNTGYQLTAYNTALDTVSDDRYSELTNPLSGWPSVYKHGKVNNFIRLAVKDTALAATAFSYKFLIKVTTYSRTGASSTFNVTIPLSYDPATYKPYRDVSVYRFVNAHKFTCNILSVTDAVTNASITFSNLKKKFELQQIIQVERYFKSSYDEGITLSGITHSITQPGKINISWDSTSIKSPTQFELEWMHVDNYGEGYADFLKDYTKLYQDFNTSTGVNAGWSNLMDTSSSNYSGIANGCLYFNKGASYNYSIIGTVPGRSYRVIAKVREITPGANIDLIVFNPGYDHSYLTVGQLQVHNDFVAVNDTTPIAILNNNLNVMCKIEEVTLLDITYEPLSGQPYFKPAELLNYSFKNNATRVRLLQNQYTIENVYESGYLLFRLRRVRPDSVTFTQEKFGVWSPNTADEGKVSDYPKTILLTPHQGDSINWNYTVSYIEEGKRKDVVGYYDGLLKPRQQVAISNADKLVIVGETKYDFNGRPTVQVLPVPALKNTTVTNGQYYENELKYYNRFNTNQGNKAYGYGDFDSMALVCPVDTARSLSNSRGASKYYSPANPDKNGAQKFVPDAENYPMVHVEYMPDNTGRVRRQGGVGATHQLGKGHETFYNYSQPRSRELDRLFGSEAGFASHYKKQTVIDANGQVSISYLDMQGRVVATGLAEQSPANLDALPENRPASLMYNNLGDHNLLQDNALALTYEHTMNKTGPLYIDYRMQTSPFRDACLPMNFCFKCVYNYEITLVNKECNQVVFTFKDTIGFINPNDTLCNVLASTNLASKRYVLKTLNSNIDTVNYDSLIRINNLERGTYSLTKKLTVNKGAFDMYFNQYVTKQACVKTFDYFFNEAWNEIDTTVCNTCDTCNNDTLSYCDGLLGQLKSDVSPGGQYAEFIDENGILTPVNSTTSIFYSDKYQTIKRYTHLGKIDQIRLADGSIDSVYKADVSTFIKAFKEEWADSLVKFHPEYVYYRYCRDSLKSSYAYDFKRHELTEFDTAVAKGYLNPTGLSGLKQNYPLPTNALGEDPYFKSRPALKANLNALLTNYKQVNDTIYSVWDMAALAAFCSKRNDPLERYACLAAFNNKQVLDSLFFNRKLRNDYLKAFNSMYADVKARVIDEHLLTIPAKYNTLGNSYPTWLVGTPASGDYANKIRRYHFGKVAGIQGATDAETIQNMKDTVAKGMDDSTACYVFAEQWMQQLADCPGLNLSRADFSRANYDSIINGFVQVCRSGSKYQDPRTFYPASTVPLTDTLARFYTLDSVLQKVLGANYRTKFCNTDLLTNAYDTKHRYFESQPKDCQCVGSTNISPPKVEVSEATKDQYNGSCVEDTLVLTPFGHGLLSFFNQMRDSGITTLTNRLFNDSDYLAVNNEWSSYFNRTIVRTEVTRRDYQGSLANRSRTEWKINFLDTADKRNRCNIFVNLKDTPASGGQSFALRNVVNNGFLKFTPITYDSFNVDIKYLNANGVIAYTTLVGVSGCYKMFYDSCTEMNYDTLYGTPFAVDSTKLDSFMAVARSIRNGLVDSAMVHYLGGSGGNGCDTALTSGVLGCTLEPNELSKKLVESLSESLYMGRMLPGKPLNQLNTSDAALFNGKPDALGYYNHSMCEMSPTYGDIFSLEWSRYDGYRGFAFNPSNDLNANCFDDKNIYQDPEFIGLSQFGIRYGNNETGEEIINCSVSFGDPYHTGILFNAIDSFANFRFDSTIGAWAVDAYVFNVPGSTPAYTKGTLRVITCKDKPICPALAVNVTDSTARFRRNGYTKQELPQLYAFECVELNRYYEQLHDRTCEDVNLLTVPNLRTFTPFFFEHMLNGLAKQKITTNVNKLANNYLLPFDTTALPVALNNALDSFNYRADYVSDSLLIGFLGDSTGTNKGCQLSLRLLKGDAPLTFANLDSFYRVRADDEKLTEYLQLGSFEQGKHYFIINATDTNGTDKHYTLRGWVSCVPVYSCAVITTPQPYVLSNNACGCATCPEFAAVVDSFYNTYTDIGQNDAGHDVMLTNFVNKQLNNNLTPTEVNHFVDQCRLTQTHQVKVNTGDLLCTIDNRGRIQWLDSLVGSLQAKYGYTFKYTKINREGRYYIAFDLSGINIKDRQFFNRLLFDSISNFSGQYNFYDLFLATPETCSITLQVGLDSCSNAYVSAITTVLSSRFGFTLPGAVTQVHYQPLVQDTIGTRKQYCLNLDTFALSRKQAIYTYLDSLGRNCPRVSLSSSFSTYNPLFGFTTDTIHLLQTDTNYLNVKSNPKVSCEEVYHKVLKYQDYMYRYKQQYNREAILSENLQGHLRNWYGYQAQVLEASSSTNSAALDMLVCSPSKAGSDFVRILQRVAAYKKLSHTKLYLDTIAALSNITGLVNIAASDSAFYTGAYVYTNKDTVTLNITIQQGSNIFKATIHADSAAYLIDTVFTVEKSFVENGFWLVAGAKRKVVRYEATGKSAALVNCCQFPKPTLCFKPQNETEYLDPKEQCKQELIALATSNALEAHGQYIDSIKTQARYNYYTACLDSASHKEQINIGAAFAEYHYTLYYYDLAGNLVKTVPPAGVDTLALTNSQLVNVALNRKQYQTSNHVFAPHRLSTTYQYNSLGQVVKQRTPDAGESRFYYDMLGRLVLSQNSKQQAKGHVYSYTVRDALNRVTEVGEINASNMDADSLMFNYNQYYPAWLARGYKTQITRTYYDNPYHSSVNNLFAGGQQYLRSRVSTVAYFAYNTTNYNYATHYSYDIHGNVNTLIQDYPELQGLGNRYKYMHYHYDLISGKVNMVRYQPNQPDRFYHRYVYDADNRLTNVYTSTDSVIWDNDATYNYYKHGPLARVNLGEYNVQGIDYAYTIHGWLKGVNSNTLDSTRDMGQDGHHSSPLNFASDVFGFTLGYYQGDYKPIDNNYYNTAIAFMANTANSPLGVANNNLYNGNISHMVTAVKPLMANNKPMATVYRYDQLNRITRMETYTNVNNTTNSWNSGTASADYLSTFGYDPNGNIMRLYRAGLSTATPMDSLTYKYYPGSNKLNHVRDRETATNYPDDIDNQSTNNYAYDSIGNLVKDAAEQIKQIGWNVYGKITDITRDSNSTKLGLAFNYDAAGQRVVKVVKAGASENTWQKQYYVRDAQGNVMATYNSRNYVDNDALNIAAVTTWITTNKGTDSLVALIQANFAANATFKALLADKLVANGKGDEVLNQYSLSTMLGWDNELSRVVVNNINAHDLSEQKTLLNELIDADKERVLEALAACGGIENLLFTLLADNDLFTDVLTNLCANGYFTPMKNTCSYFGLNNSDCETMVTEMVAMEDRNALLGYLFSNGIPAYNVMVALKNEVRASTLKTLLDPETTAYENVFADIANCIDATWLTNFLTTTYSNPTLAKELLITYGNHTYLLSLAAANNANLYISNSIKFGGVKSLNNTLSNLSGFDVSQYMNMVKVRWGQAAYNSLAATMVYTQEFKLAEHHLYGSSRLGIKYADTTLVRREFTINGFDTLGNFVLDDVLDSTRLLLDTNNFYRTLALKQYEVNSHTQNVLATILDRKTPVGTSNITRYTADVVSAELTYPFHSTMPGKTFKAPNTTEYRFGASNGQEKDNEIAKGIFTADFWEYDSRLGRRWNTDPKPNPSISNYATFANNPIWFSDVDGDTIQDRYGNNVGVERGQDGKLKYSFDESYSKRKLAKAQKHFLENTAPVLEAMNQSEEGYKDIQTLNNIPTRVSIYHSLASNPDANSYFYPYTLKKSGYYEYVEIIPYFGNYSTEKGDFAEWLGVTMNVEVGHIKKEQIALEQKGYSTDPSTAEFKSAYTPLLNSATEFRIKYRLEHKQEITLEVFKGLLKYEIPFNDFNKKHFDIIKK